MRFYSDIEFILQKKQVHQSISKQEDTLYDFLCLEFGKENIQRQFRIERKVYDFLLYKKYLIEYDGYYWHEVMPNNDIIKDSLAKERGFVMYRVKEDSSRKVNWLQEVENIKNLI